MKLIGNLERSVHLLPGLKGWLSTAGIVTYGVVKVQTISVFWGPKIGGGEMTGAQCVKK